MMLLTMRSINAWNVECITTWLVMSELDYLFVIGVAEYALSLRFWFRFSYRHGLLPPAGRVESAEPLEALFLIHIRSM